MRISDWSSDVCSSDLVPPPVSARPAPAAPAPHSGQESRRRRRLSPACPACSPRAPALVRWAEKSPCISTDEHEKSNGMHFIKIDDEQQVTKCPPAREERRLPHTQMEELVDATATSAVSRTAV